MSFTLLIFRLLCVYIEPICASRMREKDNNKNPSEATSLSLQLTADCLTQSQMKTEWVYWLYLFSQATLIQMASVFSCCTAFEEESKVKNTVPYSKKKKVHTVLHLNALFFKVKKQSKEKNNYVASFFSFQRNYCSYSSPPTHYISLKNNH